MEDNSMNHIEADSTREASQKEKGNEPGNSDESDEDNL
jgi:hypothetical protein